MSDLAHPGDSASGDKSVDDLYASLLDDIGVSHVLGHPTSSEADESLASTESENHGESAAPPLPEVSRSSYVAPEGGAAPLVTDVSSIPAPAAQNAQASSGAPARRPRRSFDEVLYGGAPHHNTSL